MKNKLLKLLSGLSLVLTAFSFSFNLKNNETSNVLAASESVKAEVVKLMGPVYQPYTGSYYNGITATSGKALRDQLHTLTGKNYTSITYKNVASTIYPDSDRRPDGTTWDIYGDYAYSTSNGGNSKPGAGWNKEHGIPQSWFGEASPMVSDAYHLFPTDAYINNARGNYPLGEVSSATKSFNFSGEYLSSSYINKVGSCTIANIGTVFEPADCYKGDLARAIFYFVTRYSDKMESGASIKNGEASKVFSRDDSNFHLNKNFADLYLKWHHEDPVSQKEVNRTNGIEKHQHNRNPFIDHPEFVDAIWGSGSVIIDPVTEIPTLDIYKGTTKLTSDSFTIKAGESVTLYAYKNDVKDNTTTFEVSQSDAASVATVESYYPRVTGIKAGSISITFKLPYADKGTTKYVTKTITINVTETQGGNTGEHTTTTLDDSLLPNSYPDKEATITKDNITFGIIQVANYGNGMQFKASAGKLYNKTEIPNINSVKITEKSGKTHTNLTVSFGDSLSDAQNATGVPITTSGVDAGGASYFYIKNGSGAAYADEIIIDYGVSGGTQKSLVSLTSSGTCKTQYNQGENFDPTGLTVIANYSDGSSVDVTDKIIWEGNTNSLGNQQIVGCYTENGVNKTIVVNITVIANPINVNSILLNTERKTIKLGTTYTLVATVLPDSAVNKNLLWSSSDDAIASVNNGVVTAKAIGSCLIRVSSVSNQSVFATCSIEVVNENVAPDEVIEEEKESGCQSSVVASTLISFVAAIIGGTTILINKKKEN